ncbi:hypothetical protein [Lederbergia panacisoli]|uniref:hypothetical protein n=1 Tax=Lederbergia panacisoli TaxID=1255251 RepID=UPI00214BD2E8|nr:hypothetical protein [Lederbergia panacisoli]MCR2820589.1 hypothetical protein [Lederbergia panacisoli]
MKWNLFKRNKRCTSSISYERFALHFGVVCGCITILGLGLAIITYFHTLKPHLIFANLKKETILLQEKNKNLENKNLSLAEEKAFYLKEISELEKQRNNLMDDYQETKSNLAKMDVELLDANAAKIMMPLVNAIIYKQAFFNEPIDVKSLANSAIDNYVKDSSSLSENEKVVVEKLKQFIDEKINSSSDSIDLLEYMTYIHGIE